MKINFRLKCISTQESPVKISCNGKTFNIVHEETLLIEKELDISPSDDSIKQSPILSVQNFQVGSKSKLEIDSFCINSIDVDQGELQDFLSFDVIDNKYVDDHRLDKVSEIHLNGQLNLIVRDNMKKFFWSPYYSSFKRNDFVFDNRLVCHFENTTFEDVFGYGVETAEPWLLEQQMKKKVYENLPHPPYAEDKNYEFGCFGCSVTRGSALLPKDAWPVLLTADPLNLSLGGLGIDGIYLNLVNALKKFRWDTTVILLPNLARKLTRFTLPSGAVTRVPSTLQSEWANMDFKHWGWKTFNRQLSKDDLVRWKNLYNKNFKFLVNGHCEEYSRRIIKMIIEVCRKSGRPFYLSSWEEETYEHLESLDIADNLLPFFNKIDLARDNIHPGPKSHKDWIEKSLITKRT
jgi:hypothetical protein